MDDSFNAIFMIQLYFPFFLFSSLSGKPSFLLAFGLTFEQFQVMIFHGLLAGGAWKEN